MTIQEALEHCSKKLDSIYDSVESSAIAAWLIEWLTGISRQQRHLYRLETLTEVQMKVMEEGLQKLLLHEPIQYVTNQSWFCGMLFYVDKHVLIPRPETEELVEWVISQCRFPIQDLSILDIGTGSGCIPISLKKRLGKADIAACDISQAALGVAERNSRQLGLKVGFFELNFLEELSWVKLAKYDFVVSNPPYIPIAEKNRLDRNVVAYEPPAALFVPDEDPLLFYRALAQFGQSHLKPGGMLLVEMHENLAASCDELFRKFGYETEIRNDLQGKARMLRVWQPES